MRHSITLLNSILIFALTPPLMAQTPEERENTFDSATNQLHLPAVEVPPLGTYAVSMKLVKYDPITFELLTAVVTENSNQATANYDIKNGLLNIPAIRLNNEIYAAELLWDGTVNFKLTYIIPTSELLETPVYPTDVQLRQIHKNQEVSFKGITYPISDEITESHGKRYYFAKYGRFRGGAYGIYIPQDYDGINPLPLVVASHGV